jgi:hypothetical protein
MKSMPQDTFISRWPWFVTAGIVETVSLGDCGRFSDVSQKCQRAKGEQHYRQKPRIRKAARRLLRSLF